MKASTLLSCVGGKGRPDDHLKVLELGLNKSDILLERSRLFVVKIGKVFALVPFSLTKVEVRMRNIIINMRPKFEAISRFINLYLDVYALQAKVEKKQEAAWREEQKKKEKEADLGMTEAKTDKKSKKQASVVPAPGNEEPPEMQNSSQAMLIRPQK